ncbi:MAG: hypothetical protein ACJ76L_01450 [Conexibacter sp.]
MESSVKRPLRTRVLMLAVCVAALCLAFASSAFATPNPPANFCMDVRLPSGGSCVHGVGHGLQEVDGWSIGTAATCVGAHATSSPSSANTIGPYCGAAGATAYTPDYNSPGIYGYPSLHDHSSYQSTFEGKFYYW